MLRQEDTLNLDAVAVAYRTGRATPGSLIKDILSRISERGDDHVWICRVSGEELIARAHWLEVEGQGNLALYGVPFAVKDNIDVEGYPTTAGCPAYSYIAKESAPVVQKLLDAGAIFIGKTNLDQFATGLVGVRSPYGIPANPFDAEYIPGGSSSGSAVAVSSGLVSFALGTDTAGSGRVPAAFNNIVGLKPTRGALSIRGVVPACRSLDCVSILALTASDAKAVLDVAAEFDSKDPFSRKQAIGTHVAALPTRFHFAIPQDKQLEFFGNCEAAQLFSAAAERLEKLGGIPVEIDFEPFQEAARLLYEGPWLAERQIAVGGFIESHPNDVHPVTKSIIEKAKTFSAADAFQAYYRLKEIQTLTSEVWDTAEVLLTPTAGTIYKTAEVEADPITLNSNLGYYTNFLNLLDLAAVAVPAGFLENNLPFGVTLVGPAFSDSFLADLGASYMHAVGGTLGATNNSYPALHKPRGNAITGDAAETITVAVVGAHMTDLPLNYQLTERGGTFAANAKTAPTYKLFVLDTDPPLRPGMVRMAGGRSIELELWELPISEFGGFVAQIPSPLGIGTVKLENGKKVQGFLCESHVLANAEDISAYGGWRAYLAAQPLSSS